MAIEIVVNLDAQQDEVKLPMRIDLTQTLKSSETSEKVTIQYNLNPDNAVWFEGNTKSMTRNETISRAETPINHRAKLIHGPGDEVERATIRQVITDGLGIETPDQTFITIVQEGGS